MNGRDANGTRRTPRARRTRTSPRFLTQPEASQPQVPETQGSEVRQLPTRRRGSGTTPNDAA